MFVRGLLRKTLVVVLRYTGIKALETSRALKVRDTQWRNEGLPYLQGL